MTEKIRSWIFANPVIVIFLIAQSVALIIWGAKIDGRVDVIEKYGSPAVQELKSKITVIETRQNVVLDVLKDNGRKIEELSIEIRRTLLPPKL